MPASFPALADGTGPAIHSDPASPRSIDADAIPAVERSGQGHLAVLPVPRDRCRPRRERARESSARPLYLRRRRSDRRPADRPPARTERAAQGWTAPWTCSPT